MTGIARRFWLFVVPLLVGFAALGLLVLSFLFPGDLYPVGSTGRVATAVVAAAALAVVVWRTVAVEGQVVGGLDEQGR